MKVINQVKWYLQEVRGDRLNATVKEMELLADFAAWVDKKAAQQSVQRTAGTDTRPESIRHPETIGGTTRRR